MKPKTVFFGYIAVLVIMTIAALIFLTGDDVSSLTYGIWFGILAASALAFMIMYRCPHCGYHLNLFVLVLPWHHCPKCGKHLDADPDQEDSVVDAGNLPKWAVTEDDKILEHGGWKCEECGKINESYSFTCSKCGEPKKVANN